jgi:hypothetical protein
MSFANPTPLQVGMSGALFGKSYRVAGRVVLGTEQDGQTYYWNEFNLIAADGETATLVFEPTEHGGEWRLFILFEPENPITAADAATKRVGDPLNLEGTDVRVTLVSRSRIYHIEGEAPEGEEVGDVAQYFNAEAGNTMIVVSWTGDEVECYRGIEKLPYATVKEAFGLQSDMPGSFGSFDGLPDTEPSYISWMKPAGVLLVAIIAVVAYASFTSRHPVPAITRTSAPTSRLRLGDTLKLDGREYHFQSHQMMEIAEVGLLFDRHEYQLSDAEGTQALLVGGLKPGGQDWAIFTALQPLAPMTPQHAAAFRAGDAVTVDAYGGTVRELFRSTLRQAESAESAALKDGTEYYGFIAQSGSALLLVRWNETAITFYVGRTLSEPETASLK